MKTINGQMKSGKVTTLSLLLIFALAAQSAAFVWLYRQHRVQQQQLRVAMVSQEQPVSVARVVPLEWPRPVTAPLQHQIDAMVAEAEQAFADMRIMMERMDAGWERLNVSPAMDMKTLPDRYEITYSLPGVRKEDVHVRVDGRMVTVQATRDERGRGRTRQGQFEHRVLLPGSVDSAHEARVSFTNHVLKVVIPRGDSATGAYSRVSGGAV